MLNELNDIRERLDVIQKSNTRALHQTAFMSAVLVLVSLYIFVNACIVWHVLKQQKAMGVLRLQLRIVHSRRQVSCITQKLIYVNSQETCFNAYR